MTTKNFLIIGDRHLPNSMDGAISERLPAGAYTVKHSDQGEVWFVKLNINSDKIIALPSQAYTQITTEIKQFLLPETKAHYEKLGFLYKRSALLHGLPGTGKTCIVNRVIQDVIAMGGVVLFSPYLRLMDKVYGHLNDVQPDVLTLVVFEEFDDLASDWEHELLSLLDGEVQKNNVMYLATTNNLEEIPKRLLRPGRMSSVIEAHYPTAEAREVYLSAKLGADYVGLSNIVGETEGLSIDDLKEYLQAVVILGGNASEVVARLRATKGLGGGADIKRDYDDFATLNPESLRRSTGRNRR